MELKEKVELTKQNLSDFFFKTRIPGRCAPCSTGVCFGPSAQHVFGGINSVKGAIGGIWSGSNMISSEQDQTWSGGSNMISPEQDQTCWVLNKVKLVQPWIGSKLNSPDRVDRQGGCTRWTQRVDVQGRCTGWTYRVDAQGGRIEGRRTEGGCLEGGPT